MKELLKKASKRTRVYWVQEENVNSGAFSFVLPRLERIIRSVGLHRELKYVGRRGISTTAVGSGEIHKKESAALLEWVQSIIV